MIGTGELSVPIRRMLSPSPGDRMPRLTPPTSTEPSGSGSPSARRPIRRRRGRVALATAAAVTLALVGTAGPAVAHGGGHKKHDTDNVFQQVNLVSDVPGLAKMRDTDVVNPWGIDFGTGSKATPLWVSNQGSNTLTLYTGATKATPKVTKLGLVIKANSPTGMLFNPTKKFVITQGGKKAP